MFRMKPHLKQRMRKRVERTEVKKQIVRLRYGVIGEVVPPQMSIVEISKLINLQYARVAQILR